MYCVIRGHTNLHLRYVYLHSTSWPWPSCEPKNWTIDGNMCFVNHGREKSAQNPSKDNSRRLNKKIWRRPQSVSLSNKQRSNKKARIQKYCKITDIRSTSAGKTPSLVTPPTGKSPGRLRTSPHTARARRKTGFQEFWSTGILENITIIENCVVENLSFSLIFFWRRR